MMDEASTAADWDNLTFTLDAGQLAVARERVDKLNARAQKKGLGGLLAVESKPVQRSETDEHTGMTRTWTEYAVRITGEAPAYGGWEFIATIDADPYAGLIVRAIPGGPKVDRERLRDGWCDECRTRRDRTATYVVRNTETGEQRQVGSTCIKDFLGWSGAVFIPALAVKDDEDDEGGCGMFGGRSQRSDTPETVLAYAWAVIKLRGWVPASSYSDTPTKHLVLTAMYPNSKNPDEIDFARSLRPLAEEAMEAAARVKAFVLSDDFAGGSDYVANLKQIIAAEQVTTRNFGLAVSAPQAYARHQEKTLIREKAKTDRAASSWVGKVKERREFTVTVVGVGWTARPAYTRYDEGGSTAIYTLADEAGNLLKWFSSAAALGEEPGGKFRIKATVKAHTQWQGGQETQLTRGSLLEVIEEPAEATAA